MDDRKLIKLVAVVILAPIVVGIGAQVVVGIMNGVTKLKYNKKIKDGLKNGSIVEVDGKYYEVEVEEA